MLKPGYCTEVEFIRVIDGDTYEFEIRRTFHVRLNGIDVPEKKTSAGQIAIEYVKSLFEKAKKILIFIPTGDPMKLMDVNSFERIVADVEVDGKNLATMLKRKKYVK